MSQRSVLTFYPMRVTAPSGIVHQVRDVRWPYEVFENGDGSRVAVSAGVQTVCSRFIQDVGSDTAEVTCKQCRGRAVVGEGDEP